MTQASLIMTTFGLGGFSYTLLARGFVSHWGRKQDWLVWAVWRWAWLGSIGFPPQLDLGYPYRVG